MSDRFDTIHDDLSALLSSERHGAIRLCDLGCSGSRSVMDPPYCSQEQTLGPLERGGAAHVFATRAGM